jgi:hypothetical protein
MNRVFDVIPGGASIGFLSHIEPERKRSVSSRGTGAIAAKLTSGVRKFLESQNQLGELSVAKPLCATTEACGERRFLYNAKTCIERRA